MSRYYGYVIVFYFYCCFFSDGDDHGLFLWDALLEKCPYLELLRSAFCRIWTEYSVSHLIQSECGKIRTRITPNTDSFYAVMVHGQKYVKPYFQQGKLLGVETIANFKHVMSGISTWNFASMIVILL